MNRARLVPALAAGLLAPATVWLAACGSGGTAAGGTTSAPVRAAASAPQVCPNVGSNAAALLMDNRVGGDLQFEASGINCADWSQGGNPTTYSGRVFGDWNKLVRWGVEPARGATPTFIAAFRTYPGGQAVASLQVRLLQIKQSGVHDWQPSYIETRLDYGGHWVRSGSYVVGTLNGRKVRVVTGVVLNPNDGTWDTPNGAGRAQRAWFMRFQYAS